jgi:hypothetical protein
VPLSEHEQRLLDQIERALYQEDPKFASTVRQTDLRTHMRRRLRRAGLVLAVGFVLLLAGVVSTQLAISVAGFVVMVGALMLAMTSWKRLGSGPSSDGGSLRVVGSDGSPSKPSKPRGGGRAGKSPRSGSFTERLEERWKKRWDERGAASARPGPRSDLNLPRVEAHRPRRSAERDGPARPFGPAGPGALHEGVSSGPRP